MCYFICYTIYSVSGTLSQGIYKLTLKGYIKVFALKHGNYLNVKLINDFPSTKRSVSGSN